MTTPTSLSRGEFGLTAAPRILALLKAHGLRSTWFTPGFTIESHPKICEQVAAAGHEIGHHSWAHIPPATQTRAEEEADLVRANAAIEKLTGAKARGYRSPSWDLSEHTLDLLEAHGFLYDSSLMGADYWPYRPRRGDVAALGSPFRFGEEIGRAHVSTPVTRPSRMPSSAWKKKQLRRRPLPPRHPPPPPPGPRLHHPDPARVPAAAHARRPDPPPGPPPRASSRVRAPARRH